MAAEVRTNWTSTGRQEAPWHVGGTTLNPKSCFQVAAEARMGLDVEDYVASFQPDLADALFQWCRGASFAEIAKLSHVFEAGLPALPAVPCARGRLPSTHGVARACSVARGFRHCTFSCLQGMRWYPRKPGQATCFSSCINTCVHATWRSIMCQTVWLMRVRGKLQGSLVRAVRRVEEVLRQAATGAGIMGEASLVALFQQGSERIKRDVIFAASLYL